MGAVRRAESPGFYHQVEPYPRAFIRRLPSLNELETDGESYEINVANAIGGRRIV